MGRQGTMSKSNVCSICSGGPNTAETSCEFWRFLQRLLPLRLLSTKAIRKERVTMSEQKYVTRKEGVKLVRERGIPLTINRVNKDAMDGCGPAPAGKYGPGYLYTPEEFLRYAHDRIVKRAPEGEP